MCQLGVESLPLSTISVWTKVQILSFQKVTFESGSEGIQYCNSSEDGDCKDDQDGSMEKGICKDLLGVLHVR